MTQIATEQDCADRANHTPSPAGYNEWHEWAERMKETHDQTQCPTCGFWAIWTPREGTTPAGLHTSGERTDNE